MVLLQPKARPVVFLDSLAIAAKLVQVDIVVKADQMEHQEQAGRLERAGRQDHQVSAVKSVPQATQEQAGRLEPVAYLEPVGHRASVVLVESLVTAARQGHPLIAGNLERAERVVLAA